MGKKSKRRSDNEATNNNIAPDIQPHPSEQQPYPHSDGPSEEELTCLQTDSPSLQQKLDQLATLANSNDREQFVSQFVPLDLEVDDVKGFLNDLTVAAEAEGQWNNLKEEIVALARGKGVTRIEGDQTNRAIFFFEHPTLKGCDREVSFVCTGGEWRAEG